MWKRKNALRDSASVLDQELGLLLFPEKDRVMLPTIANTQVWEPEEIAFLKHFLRSGMKCINVGANIGYHSKHISRIIGETGRVYCYEPNPKVFKYLQFNLLQEELHNFELYDLAIGAHSGSAKLFLNDLNFGDSRLMDPRLIKETVQNENLGFYGKIRTTRVQIKSLDDIFLKKNLKIDLILSDAQGWDCHVIRGGLGLIKRDYPTILFEYVPNWIKTTDPDPNDFFEELRNLDYEFFTLGPSMLSPLSPGLEVEELSRRDSWYSNVICITKNLRHTIKVF
jgi:FkbM family methyltransferase